MCLLLQYLCRQFVNINDSFDTCTCMYCVVVQSPAAVAHTTDLIGMKWYMYSQTKTKSYCSYVCVCI